MDKNYNHIAIQEKCEELWQIHKHRHTSHRTFSIAIPPPNCSGRLHIGHALNNTFNDILARYYHMKGYNVNLVAGTDSAGISCQYVVTRQLIKDGINPTTLSRDAIVEHIEKWVDTYGGTILSQMSKLGIMPDTTRYTKDLHYDKCVMEAFIKMYNDGLIYKGKYLCNYCCKCLTALSNDEVKEQECAGKLYYIKYTIDETTHIVAATTRPETIFGDMAIVVNPSDERYADFIGKTCVVPIIGRTIPIISDVSIDPGYGTGAMKVTPGHNKQDYELAQSHSIEIINIIDNYGKLIGTGTAYDGKKLHILKSELVTELTANGCLLKTTDTKTLAKTCYKCENPIEYMLSEQYFIKMKPLAAAAIEAVDKITFYPERHRTVYLHWLENIHDWCISRDIAWAHQIPIYNCECGKSYPKITEPVCECGKTPKRETKVLDTWFASALYPFAIFKDPADFEKFFPLDVVISGSDILFFWIARMVMMSLYFHNRIPFKDVYLHGLIRDTTGAKMSKTLGNVIDPLEIIEKVGTDALRFSLMYNFTEGHDAKLSSSSFSGGRTFCTKLWNCVRYFLTTRTHKGDLETITDVDSEQIENVNKIIKQAHDCIIEYDFTNYAKKLYAYVWNDFCNIYIESIKNNMSDKITQTLLVCIVKIITALHPLIPYITEELYQILKATYPKLDLFHESVLMNNLLGD